MARPSERALKSAPGGRVGRLATRMAALLPALTASWAAEAQVPDVQTDLDLPWTLVGARVVLPRTCSPGRRMDRDVYPGIDLTVESSRQALAYRFDVAPGADPNALRLRYAAAERVAVEEAGRALRVRRGRRTVRESGLRCFQEDRDVPCRYAVVGRTADAAEVAFDIASYDPSMPLVVDPVIGWSTYLGGSGDDFAERIAVDSDGNACVVGRTSSTDFPATGGFDTTLGGSTDAFVAKVSADGTGLIWASYVGGSDGDEGRDVAVDGLGNLYVVGRTSSPDLRTDGGFDAALGGSSDAFVTKVSADGTSLVWSSYLGGSEQDQGSGLAMDGGDNIYVVGSTSSTDFPVAGGFDTALGGLQDAFVAKMARTEAASRIRCHGGRRASTLRPTLRRSPTSASGAIPPRAMAIATIRPA